MKPHNNMNPFERKLQEKEDARKLWQESEWVLNFLRTQTGIALSPPTDEEILRWYQQIQQQ